jgi:outer membrane protein assembly factor BamB
MSADPSESSRREQRVNEAIAAYLQAVDAGRLPQRAEFLAQHADVARELEAFFADRDRFRQAARPLGADASTVAPGEPSGVSRRVTAAAATVRYFGDYELLEEIARGGMGIVYKARQVSLDRLVALKMILAGQLASASEVERFRTEAEAAANLDHPNIVPIFEVGEHEGQHYFSMKLLDGGSLADHLDRFRNDPRAAAQLVATVARAVHHAHQRGILHRDLKPANVLLQGSAIAMVTDFGLAKRVDSDRGITQSGAIVGTPGYMPPEQAAGKKKGISTASDVYSLGAILYALLAGRPPFQAETPFSTVMQVLQEDPQPPRRFNPRLHPDLEAICLKCLAKDPAQRYGSAEALAEDLERWLSDKPVRARRAGLDERVVRWLWRRRRALLLAATPVLLMLAGIFGWQWYANAHLGQLFLTSAAPTLRTEVFDEEDRPVGKPFTVPTIEPVSLPEGDYQVRLSQPAMLSETYLLHLARGNQPRFPMGLEPRRLWEPIAVPELFEILDVGGGHPDVLVVGNQGLHRFNGATGNAVWSRVHQKGEESWAEYLQMARQQNQNPWVVFAPMLVRPAPDLDGDGTRDLVWASRRYPSLIAFSGATGKLLWRFAATRDREGKVGPGNGEVAGEPVVADVNGDGVPDVIALFRSGMPLELGPAWIQAVSGRDGTSLWHRELPWPHRAEGREFPYAMKVLNAGNKRIVVAAVGRLLLSLDLQTGEIVQPELDLGSSTHRVQLVDLGGKGEPDALLVEKGPLHELTLEAIALTTRRPLWSVPLRTHDRAWSEQSLIPQAPVVAPLNVKGKTQVILFHRHSATNPWSEVEVVDGRTGQVAWQRRWPRTMPMAHSIKAEAYERLIVGPDIDGDGFSDVFVASADWSQPTGWRLMVEAFSGQDGRSLWKWHAPPHVSGGWSVAALHWWQAGPDGWPLLLVPFTAGGPEQSVTYILAAGSGRLAHLIADAPPSWDDPVDLDGDGIRDLYWLRQGRLETIRGAPPEAWRRMGPLQPAADFDGDGIVDLIAGFDDPQANLSAVSGRDGRLLWKSDVRGSAIARDRTVFWTAEAQGTLTAYVRDRESVPLADLDGDGVPDLFVFQPSNPQQPLQAVSGKTGRLLWRVNGLTAQPGDRVADAQFVRVHNLGGSASSEVLFAYNLESHGSQDGQLWLAALSGEDGRIRWKTPLAPKRNVWSASEFGPLFVDLNGDGVLDVVVWAIDAAENYEVRALSGRDGSLLWKAGLNSRAMLGFARDPILALAPADGAGRPGIVVAYVSTTFQNEIDVTVLDGAQGKPRNTWKLAERLFDAFPRNVQLIGADRDEPGRGAIGAIVMDGKTNEPVLILRDFQGKEQGRAPVSRSTLWPGARLWRGDLAGDGHESVVFVSAGKVQAMRPDGRSVWKQDWPLPAGGDIVTLLPGSAKNQPAVIVAQSGRDLFGLDGATGQPRWRCHGPGLFAGLLGLVGTDPPRIVFESPKPGPGIRVSNTVCRQALATDAAGRCVSATESRATTMPSYRNCVRVVCPVQCPWPTLPRWRSA